MPRIVATPADRRKPRVSVIALAQCYGLEIVRVGWVRFYPGRNFTGPAERLTPRRSVCHQSVGRKTTNRPSDGILTAVRRGARGMTSQCRGGAASVLRHEFPGRSGAVVVS